MDIRDLILDSREKKKEKIESLIRDYNVVTVRANIVGKNKCLVEAYLLVNHFSNLVNDFNPINIEIIDTIDGPTTYALFSKDHHLKDEMIKMEEEDDLGRFIDLDVFENSSVSLSRGSLRKCYLCDKPAFVCAREHNHREKEILDFIQDSTMKSVDKKIIETLNDAILSELNLEPKFGLVTPSSSGSHRDMNYQIMVDAKDAIIPYFKEMFFRSILITNDNINNLLNEIRPIGLKAEKEMYKASEGINAYKGLIFVLGIIISSIGFKVSRITSDSIFDISKKIAHGVTNELLTPSNTFGYKAYLKYHITGARGEAENGFPNVQKILNNSLTTNMDYLTILIKLIQNVDDTILLKRCGNLDFYRLVKDKFSDVGNIQELNDWCIQNNLSFGGSADLLIVVIFIEKISKYFMLGEA